MPITEIKLKQDKAEILTNQTFQAGKASADDHAVFFSMEKYKIAKGSASVALVPSKNDQWQVGEGEIARGERKAARKNNKERDRIRRPGLSYSPEI